MTRRVARRSLALAVAAVLIGASSSCSDGEASDPVDPVALSVDVLATNLRATAAVDVVSVGRSLVALALGAGEGRPRRFSDPLRFSTDGGETWTASDLPDVAWIDRALSADSISLMRLVAIDATVLAVGGPRGLASFEARTPPILWVSMDGGRSFSAPPSVGKGVTSGSVQTVVATNGDLMALGEVDVTVGGERRRDPAIWTSTDRGSRWRRKRSVDAGDGFGSIAVASGGAVMTTQPGDSSILRSVDGGRRWSSVGLDSDARPIELRKVGPIVLVSSRTRTFLSEDDGASWRELGAPPPPEDELLAIGGGVDVVEIDEQTFLGIAEASDELDEVSSGRLVRSTDGGRTWATVDTTRKPPCRLQLGGPSYGDTVRLGRILVVVWWCSSQAEEPTQALISSDDDGKTWRRVGSQQLPDLASVVIQDGARRSLVHRGRALFFGSANADPALDQRGDAVLVRISA